MTDNTFSAFANFLRWEREAADGTIQQYCRALRVFGYPGRAFERDAILEFLKRPSKGRQPSGSRWNAELAALRAFGGFLEAEGEMSDNPTDGIRWRSVHESEKHPLTFDEMIRLLDAFADLPPFLRTRNELIVLVCLHCALRVSELVSLKLSQIGVEARLFYRVRRKRGRELAAAFNDVVAAALEQYLVERQRLLGQRQQDALLLSKRCTPLSVRSVQKTVQRYAQLAGISGPNRPVTPHTLRHSSATQYSAIGTSLPVVQNICGHKRVSTTQRYVHTSLEQRRVAAQNFGAAWKKLREGGE